MGTFWIKKGLKIGFFVILAIVVFGYAFQYLWNWLVPTLFSGPVITLWQAYGLLILSKIIFGGFGRKCHGCHGDGGHWKNHWRAKMGERMKNMSPEEREQFKEKLRRRCESWGKPGRFDDLMNEGEKNA